MRTATLRYSKGKFERPYAEVLKRGVNFCASLGNHDVRRRRDAEMKYSNFHRMGRRFTRSLKVKA